MNKYKTKLTESEEKEFLNWYRTVAIINKLDINPDHPDHHYDYRGFWKNSSDQDKLVMSLMGGNKHFPDKWKTPLHPTFSNESIYSNDFMKGGTWDGDNFIDSEWTKSREYIPQLSDIIDFIKSYEDFSSTVYTVNGQKLIGYGFADADLITKGHITKKEADRIIVDKVKSIESDLSKKVPNWSKLNRGTQLALIDIAYNGNGPKTIYEQSPKLMKLLESDNFTFQQIANELDHSKNSGGWLGVRSAARRAMVTGHYYWNSPNKDSKGRHVNPSIKSNTDSERSPYLKFQSGGNTRQVFQLNTIPTKNKVIVIDNFSPNYNYIVEGDKVYYARKGRDYWVDISDNDSARQNLLKHLSQYDFKGYDDNERNLWLEDPKKQKKSPTSGVPPFAIPNEQSITVTPNVTDNSDKNDQSQISDDNYDPDKWNWQLIKSGLRRYYDKLFTRDPEVIINEPPQLDSEYAIYPGVQVSDTLVPIRSDFRNRYHLSEYIPQNAYTYSGRNRGDYSEIKNTEGAPITLLNPLLPYNKNTINPNGTYIGYDSNGNLKVGIGSDFKEGDTLSKSFRNQIVKFEVDQEGNVIGQHKNKNRGHMYPVTWFYNSNGEIVSDKNTPDRSAVSVMFRNPNSYGGVEGGRVIIQTGNEVAVVSGSINTIHKKFEEMKKRNNVDSGFFYTLDNGSFTRGLRTKDKVMTSEDLKLYDQENKFGGGNFMYITGTPSDKFPSDTVWTPNIRTEESESFKKGHSLTNEQKGVLLHHTAFEGDPNLTHVTRHFMNPKSEASSHVVIGEDGKRRVFATPDKVTFHAGSSYWNGRSNVNDFMIGIEFQGNTLNKPLTDLQIQSAVEYLEPIIRENNIRLEDITTHEQVRTLYNQYRKDLKLGPKAESKSDITLPEYERVINALKEKVYYKK